MVLRRVVVERYGCFNTAEFEFRRGLNLVSGGADSGKSLLLAAIPAAFCGIDQGVRRRTWGELLNCRVALHFEDGEWAVRLNRDLESNLVRLEEREGSAPWRECFNALVPPCARPAERGAYLAQLKRLFGVGSEAALELLLDPARADALLGEDGRPLAGLLAALGGTDLDPAAAELPADEETRQRELAALEEELAAARSDYRQGEEYLAWIRRRWQEQARRSGAKGGGKQAAAGRQDPARRRAELAGELRAVGLPDRLPADLPAMFEAAEGLRQELSAVQQELTPLQRRRQAVNLPGLLWPLLLPALALAAGGPAVYLDAALVLPWAAVATLLLGGWLAYTLSRFVKARRVLADLDAELALVEGRRNAALERQQALAERFENHGLPSSAVDMVKLQQLCQRHAELLNRYLQACAEAGEETGTSAAESADRHLRPEELPQAEERLAALGETIRRREQRLALLTKAAAGGVAAPAAAADAELLKAVSQQLDRLTAGRCTAVALVDGTLQLDLGQGRRATPAAAGGSTRAALALAARLALAQRLGARLPLPVDEPSLPGDQRRRQGVLRALERWARDGQLLLAASDDDLARRAGREHWQVIDLDRAAAGTAAANKEKSDAGQLHLL